MISLEWIDAQMAYLTSHLEVYKPESGEDFFFDPTPGFYGFIAQGITDDLNEAMRMLGKHIGSPSAPIIEDWRGPANPLVTEDQDWAFDDEPPGLIRYDGPHRSRIQIAITNKHSPLIMGAILAHELTHHYLANKGICYLDVEENERLTDLATAYLGLGKPTFNGYVPITWTIQRFDEKITYTYRVGYLSSREMAAIVDRVCTFRHIPIEVVRTNLSHDALRLLKEAHSFAVCDEKKKQVRTARQEHRRVRREKMSVIFKRIFPRFPRAKEAKEQVKELPGITIQQGMVLTCGNCAQKMRVPIKDRDLCVKCPSCNKEFILHSRRR